MRLSPLLDRKRVLLLEGPQTRDSVLTSLAGSLSDGTTAGSQAILQAFLEREALGPTDSDAGTAFPHAVTPAVPTTMLAIAKLAAPPGDSAHLWQKVDLVFAVGGPEQEKWEHLRLFARLFRFCRTPAFMREIRRLNSVDSILQLVLDEDTRHV